MNRRPRVEQRPDDTVRSRAPRARLTAFVRRRRPAPQETTGRVLDPLHRHALPAGGRRRDGLLGELGGVAPQRDRRPLLLPQALPHVRPDRAGGDAPGVAARARRHPGDHAGLPGRLVLPDDPRDAAGVRRDGERRHAVARLRAAAVPAVGDAEGGAHLLRGAGAGGAAAGDQDARRAGQAAPDRGGRGVPAAAEAAGHGHRHDDLLRARRAPDRPGTPIRLLGGIFGVLAGLATLMALVEPYRRERLTSFLDPFSDAGDSGFQAVQALTAIGSGGFFGVGLGESVQKIFYLPEAHTDTILAIIGEELGLLGILGVIGLYGMIAYAGLRTAKLARDLHSQLLAAGITSLILCQATLNFFAVLGMAPLTGVPLPFLSYGSTNLIVLMGAMGLLLDVAATGG